MELSCIRRCAECGGDAACDIEFRADGDAGLTDLPVVVDPSCVDSGAACANLGVELLGELEELVEALFGADAVATGNDDGRTFEVVLGSLDVAVDDLDDVVGRGDVFGDIVAYDLTIIVLVATSFFMTPSRTVAI